MKIVIRIVFILSVSAFTACGPASADILKGLFSDEIIDNEKKITDEHPRLGDDKGESSEGPSTEPLNLTDQQIENAYLQFVNQGVPQVALRKAIDFYKINRFSMTGLKDTSCLIMPMSESGEITPDQHRYDTTTLVDLNKGIRNDHFIVIVDFTQTNNKLRGYILDMRVDKDGIHKLHQETISHGYGSRAIAGIPQVFTNKSGLGTTVSGFHITAMDTYKFYGRSRAHGNYISVGLRLYGLESTNNTAEMTSKVTHGAPYNSDKKSGTSAGCPAFTLEKARKHLPNLVEGALWYHYTKVNQARDYKTSPCSQ